MSEIRPHPEWQIGKIRPEMVKPLDEAFREVIDPEIGLNIQELGLIRDVQILEGTGHIIMIMTTPFCPYAPALLESARAKGESIIKLPTTIEMGMEYWDPTYMEEGVGSDWGLF